MRKRAIAASILSSAAVLVVGWQLGAPSALMTSVPSASSGGGTSAGPSTAGSSTATGPSSGGTSNGSAPAATAAPAAPAAPSGTFTGSSTSTRFGSVQVQITVAGGAITDVAALKLTDADGRSVQISNRAAPVLRQEVLAAQSAQVSTVSGATYTSEAYLTSLQSALDQAGL
ncbi:FMN-binding protein [Cryobacterium arcticum]|uniref:FMN-binding protein n=1 Tax=Cryobacterium arcticum TaxID=670052 RepID=A0A1B1BIR6_9MICO|nr:FMN-binding protein [Cryobacterium arcticum]ANP72386.1 FMN-binding protein [Cryobacterium arcticum]